MVPNPRQHISLKLGGFYYLSLAWGFVLFIPSSPQHRKHEYIILYLHCLELCDAYALGWEKMEHCEVSPTKSLSKTLRTNWSSATLNPPIISQAAGSEKHHKSLTAPLVPGKQTGMPTACNVFFYLGVLPADPILWPGRTSPQPV